MNILITLNYNTVPGEKLFLRNGNTVYEMTYIKDGHWQIELEKLKGKTYSFEVRNDNACLRKEWKEHRVPVYPKGKRLIIKDRWIDCPSDAAFYSGMFKDVIFKRQTATKATKKSGNILISFLNATVKPSQIIAITGSGEKLGNWTKFIPMDDSDFPLWSINIDVCEPIEYKFVVLDKTSKKLLFWEEGENHKLSDIPDKNTVIALYNLTPSFPVFQWKGAGTAIPVFSLRSETGFGTGEFKDIKKMVDWAVSTGQNIIQLLPINDTHITGTWQDSYPYNANSSFALHPQFLNLPDAGVAENKEYKTLQKELNLLDKIDYEKVNREKERLLRKVFEKKGLEILSSNEYNKFYIENKDWLEPYAVFNCLSKKFGTADFSKWGKYAKYSKKIILNYISDNKEETGFYCFEQYLLDQQLKDVVNYAHKFGIVLKGDLPIGISRTSADAWTHPELFNMDSQAGAPPDAFSALGQNWGFPTYNWENMAKDDYAWWKSRLRKMSEYFDCFRIDHILGFFRIWEIPYKNTRGLSGYFNPALPYSSEELKYKGFDMYSGRYSTPILEDWVLYEIFGNLSNEVKEKYIQNGRLVPEVSTQRNVDTLFDEKDEKEKRLKDGFMWLLDDVLFIEDPHHPGYWHPRIAAHYTFAYRALNDYQKQSFNNLYTDFFYHRHNDFWKQSALSKLPSLLESTDMLACGEDLGMIPACVPDTMKELSILSLEIQRMPKDPKVEFANPETYPYMCVCATGTHDTSTLRAWWEEDREASGRYYRNMLGCYGETPYFCEPWICEKIVHSHLNSPAMLTILPLQDWLSISGEVRYPGNPADERINIPSIPHHYWRYRMHITLEALIKEREFNSKMKQMISESHRG